MTSIVIDQRRDDRIRIDDTITITVMRVNDDRVSLGFDAPPDVSILRRELLERTPLGKFVRKAGGK